MSTLTPADVDAVCDLVDNLCGICWDSSKAYLIESRLTNIFKRSGCVNYVDFAQRVKANMLPALKSEVIDAVTTHETLWFRDNSPFEALKHKIFPELIDAKAATAFPKRFRIWSAACSTGQESYSLAMMLCELLPDPRSWDILIHGTDISDGAVSRASAGFYADHEIARGLPAEYRAKYFRQEKGGWRVTDELRSMVSFQRRNLLEPFTGLGKFDVVLCRNVAIYFTPTTRRDLFLRIAATMSGDGYLFVGSQECLRDLGPQFVPHHHCRAVFYRPTRPMVGFPC
jgi:chemotaxis protein methyltransferase CheR